MNIEKTDSVIYAETNPKEYFDKICNVARELHPTIIVNEMAPHDPKDFMNLHMIKKEYAFDDLNIEDKTRLIIARMEDSKNAHDVIVSYINSLHQAESEKENVIMIFGGLSAVMGIIILIMLI